jgi:streptogramin lyase
LRGDSVIRHQPEFINSLMRAVLMTMINQLAGGVVAMSLIATSGHAQPFTFRNVAGNSTIQYGGSSDGANAGAQFHGPAGLAVDSQGNLYVADQFNFTIRKITPLGTNWVVTTIAGSSGQSGLQDGTNAHALFNSPTGITADLSGNLFVADQYNNAIRKVSPVTGTTNWVITTIAGQGLNNNGFADGTNRAATFHQPAGIAVDANGNLFVADQYNNAIRKVTPVKGTTNWVVTTIAGQGPNNSGTANGTNKTAQFNAPSGIAVDAGGHLFVADQFNNEIRKLTPSGTNWIVTTIAGCGPGNPGSADGANTGEFNTPTGLAVDTNGNVYVADEENDTIRKLTPLGANWVTSTIGGQPQKYGTNNGSDTNALFYFPFSLAVDGKGSVFVADTANNTIRIGFQPPAILSSARPFGLNQGQFEFILTGPTAQLVVVEASSDLQTWLPIWSSTFGPGQLFFADPDPAPPPPRFYRALLP